MFAHAPENADGNVIYQLKSGIYSLNQLISRQGLCKQSIFISWIPYIFADPVVHCYVPLLALL